MQNESIEFDIKVNGKKAKSSIGDVEKAQNDLDKTVEKSSKNIKTNWTAIGAAAAVATAALGAMMKQSVELERALFGLNEETREWIRNASEQYGMSQQIIAGFVQTGKAAGMAGDDIEKMVDQAVALGRAYPHESTESFIDNLVMLNRTGEAQGYIVDILEQKYGVIDLKTLSLEQKQLALEEAVKGVNAEFDKTSASKYDKTMQSLSNTATDLGSSLMTLAEESGVLWVLNKMMEAGSTAALGYSMALNRLTAGAKSLIGLDTSELDNAFDKLVKLSEAKTDALFGFTENEDGEIDLGDITVSGTTPNIIPAASPQADKERAIALAANDRFWDEYNRTMMTAQEYELTKLSEKYAEYAKHVKDKSALDEWYATEQARIMDETSNLTQHYADMQSSVTSDLTNAMLEFTQTGQASFADMANAIIQDLIRIQIQASMSNLLGDSMGGGSGLFGMLSGMFAKGAAFSGGEVTPFANGGVVSSPTLFPMASGMGLMGEAGAEAIMPLSRTSSGDLGVKSTPPVVNVNVQNYGNDNVKIEQSGDNIQVIISQIASSISRGTGDIGTAIESRYGIRKK